MYDRLRHLRVLVSALLSLSLLMLPPAARAQQDGDFEDEEYGRGLIGKYVDDAQHEFERIDRSIAFVWGQGGPDVRLAPGRFSVEWRGYLMAQANGPYRLSAHVAGAVEIEVADQQVLSGRASTPQWIVSEPLELSFGWHPITIRYQSPSAAGRIGLYWAGPNFQLEPIGQTFLYHDREETPADTFEHGQLLARALRCAACHEGLETSQAMRAPALDRLAGNIERDWLVAWLRDDGRGHAAEPADKEKEQQEVPGGELERRMPYFGFAAEDAEAVASFLLAQPKPRQQAAQNDANGSPVNGRQLFQSLGCLACHRQDELGSSGLFGGGNLTAVAEKRPADFFARWLSDPASINSHHRMPVYELVDEERQDLAAYLKTLGSESKSASDSNPAPALFADLVERGRQLYEAHRCAACHSAADEQADSVALTVPVTAGSRWDQSCLVEPALDGHRPGYRLEESERNTLIAYVQGLPESIAASREPDGAFVLAEKNCVACHARGASAGLATRLTLLTEHHPEFAPSLPALSPPPLYSVGDKLHDRALAASIQRTDDVRRPWLLVRMPKYRLSDAELEALLRYFIESDRIPDGAPRENAEPTPAADDMALSVAGRRLVTPDGFGCTSCHQIGKVKPPKAPLNAMGPDLSMLGERIRKPYFDRWVRNPARIIPRMEMPAVQIPVQGVLGQDLDLQLAGVWHVLNEPGFQPPQPNPVRLVRRSGVPDRQEPAVILTDVLRTQSGTLLKPLLIGLPNRHNVLFDLEVGHLAGWWIGDVARQRTEGKSWYWEAAGEDMLKPEIPDSDLQIQIGDRFISPQIRGQFVTEFDWIRHHAGGATFQHRLFFGEGEPVVTAVVTQKLQSLGFSADQPRTGFERELELRSLGSARAVRLKVVSSARASDFRISRNQRNLLSGDGLLIELISEDARFSPDGSIAFASDAAGAARLRLRYSTELPVDQFLLESPQFPAPPPLPLNVVPGFRATRLPLLDELMPTALAWRPDGTMVITSLKGRVWLAHDTNGDGLEDQLQNYTDELAAPFGAVAGEKYVDVVNKYALLRIWDEDEDGRGERIETLASGWGHTVDYHDWAVGLAEDEEGNYYVALPCQQDDRSAAAAHLRGTVLRLRPRTATVDNPSAFELEPISEGHRFPIGIARDRQGELFVTDNQGNYNPFNELNHVMPGAHYGFINAIERHDRRERPPLVEPAINIPHPWTRSVNGICFLDTPPHLRRDGAQPHFGPFEGHLIGCEYDTRLLVRMSLERVGDTYQGAVYPFSLYHPEDGNTLLGPLTCAVAPDGALYVGCIRDSGWGGANNIGGLVRIEPDLETMVPGIAEVRVAPDGFVIRFTAPVRPQLAEQTANYTISSYTRVSTPDYGGPDQDRRLETIESLTASDDCLQVDVRLSELRTGYVYEIRLKNLAGAGRSFFPAEAYYSLHERPQAGKEQGRRRRGTTSTGGT